MSFVSSQVSGLFLRAAGLALSPSSAFKFPVLRVVGEKLSKCGLEILKALSAKQKYKHKHSNAFIFKPMIFAHSQRMKRVQTRGTSWLCWMVFFFLSNFSYVKIHCWFTLICIEK